MKMSDNFQFTLNFVIYYGGLLRNELSHQLIIQLHSQITLILLISEVYIRIVYIK